MVLKSQASRRYAEALVEAATREGDAALDRALKELGQFADLVEHSFDLRNALLNPVFTREEREKAMRAVLHSLNASELVQRFVALLVERDRVGEIAAVAAAFRELADQRRGRVRAEVRTAVQLSPETAERLRRTLEKSTGKSIELDVRVDPTLLGGVRTRVGSMVFDGSIRSELDRLRETLTRVE